MLARHVPRGEVSPQQLAKQDIRAPDRDLELEVHVAVDDFEMQLPQVHHAGQDAEAAPGIDPQHAAAGAAEQRAQRAAPEQNVDRERMPHEERRQHQPGAVGVQARAS